MAATGEPQTGPLRLQFNHSVKLVFCGSSISSDGCPLLHRELNDVLGLAASMAGLITEAALPREVFVDALDLINGMRGPPAEAASA